MRKLNAPIRMFGGKGMMYKNIIEFFPNIKDFDTYIEPFGGSYSVGLKLEPPPPIEIYNDLDKNIYSIYKVLSNPEMFKEFKDRCDILFYNEDLRKDFKGLLRDDNLSVIDRALYFFYVNRTSHNGVGGFSKNTYIRRNMSKAISDFLSTIDQLPELHNRLSRVIICNTDGIELIKKYNNNRTFIYADPPYHQSTRTSARYNIDMDNETQLKFLDVVINSKSKILISGYVCDEYGVLENHGFKKVDFDVKTITGNFKPKIKTETLYFNY